MKFCIESEIKKSSGIYLIKSLVDSAGYVGSAKNLCMRFNTHRAEMRKGKAINRKVEAKLEKYGLNNFEFHLLELVPIEELSEREQFHVDSFKGECLNMQFRISKHRKKELRTKKPYTLKLDEKVLGRIKLQATKENCAVSALVTSVLKQYINGKTTNNYNDCSRRAQC